MNLSVFLMRIRILVILMTMGSSVLAQPYGMTTRVPNTSFLLSTAGDTLAEMEMERVFSNLSFFQPTFLTHAHDGSDRLFIIQRSGQVVVFQNEIDATESKVFLDITDRIGINGSETGLLSMVFHPSFPDSNKVYICYTYGNLSSRISEFKVS